MTSTVVSPINGFAFCVADSDWSTDFKKRIRFHEPGVNKKLKHIMQQAPAHSVVVDAGAHVGDTGLLLASMMKLRGIPGRVIEIDPDPSKLFFITETARASGLSDYVETIHAGLGETYSSGTLDRGQHAGAWHVIEGSDFEIRPLDDIMKDRAVPFLIKLDVEGFETFAVRGARQTITRARFLMIEVVEHQLRRKGSTVRQLHTAIRSCAMKRIWRSLRDELYAHDTTASPTIDAVAAWSDADMTTWTLLIVSSALIAYTSARRLKMFKTK